MSDPAAGELVLRTPAGRVALVATVAASAMASLDATVVNVALPHIGRDLHAGIAALQWVLTGYLLAVAALILMGGALGDKFGRRRVFMVGTAWFAAASLLCGIAPDVPVLVVARILEGVGAALLTPGSLAILQSSFREQGRAAAVGAWSGLGGVAGAVGPFVGGGLVDGPGWRWAFLVNLPVAGLALACARAAVPESRETDTSARIDGRGAGYAVVALAAGTWALTDAGRHGWGNVTVVVAGIVATASAVVFVSHVRRRPDALVPRALFRNRVFTVLNLGTVLLYGALGVAFFLVAYDLEVAGHWSATRAGVALLPTTVLMLLLSARSGALAQRIGPRLQLSVGPLLAGGGLLLLARIGTHPRWATDVVPGALVFGLGLVTFVAPLTATVMASADADHLSVASGVNNAVARAAGLAALAVVPAVAGLTTAAGAGAVAHACRVALMIAAVVAALAGPFMFIGLTRRQRAPRTVRPVHCAVDGPPVLPDPGRCPVPAPRQG
jgi:EmrB/QacA subfamily drug resistance transporter